MILDNAAISDLENTIVRRVEKIIFEERRRPSGRQKRKGGLLVEDDTGELRRTLKAARGFISPTANGFEINLKMVYYFRYLDDARREELNWYFSEAVFEDSELRKKLKEITAKRIKLDLISAIKK